MEQKQNNRNMLEEREIKLSELLWRIVWSWRLIIILAVVCAILAAGLSYIKSKQTISMTSSEVKMEKTLTDEELSAVNRAKKLQQFLQERVDYQEESVYINLDAYNVNTVTLQYYIKADSLNESSTSLLADSYRKYVESKAVAKDVSVKTTLSVDSKYIGELIDYTNYDVGLSMELPPFQEQLMRLEGNYDKVLLINVMGRDADEANEVADAVEKAMGVYAKKLSGQITKHKLSLLNRFESVTTNTNLALAQENLQEAIETLQTRYNNVTANFTDAQKAALETESESGETDVTVAEVTQPMPSPSISKKNVLLGVILGIVLACILVALKYILDGRVKTADEMQEMYGLRLLGSVRFEAPKKKLFSGIDKWILALKEKNQWPLEEQINVLLANISVLCQKAEIRKVFVTSETLDENTKAKVDEILARLQEEKIETVYASNVAYNAASLKQMSEIGNAMLIVKEGSTRYAELEKELTLCGDQEINVLGAIMLR